MPTAQNQQQNKALNILAGLIGGSTALSDITKAQLKLLSGVRLGTLSYDNATLRKLGLSTGTLSKEGFLSLKEGLRGILSDRNITRLELRRFGKTTRTTLKTEKTARDKLAIDRQLKKLAADRDFGNIGGSLDRGSLYNMAAASTARIQTRKASGIGTSMRGDVNYGRNLSRATVLGV